MKPAPFLLKLTPVAIAVCLLPSCEQETVYTPTREAMQGVWVVTEARDENGNDILSKIEFPIAAFLMQDDNTVTCTAGPMFMYLVYGDNKYTQIASDIDQVFDYATLNFTNGEFFVGQGVQERFTIEMKLEGLPGQSTLDYLLNLLGIPAQWLDQVIYHKFLNVKVDFANDENTMTWEWNYTTTAKYNYKDQFGDYILWEGWPVDKFSKCKFVFHKQTKDLKTVVKDAL